MAQSSAATIARRFGGKGYKPPSDGLWRTPAWVTELLCAKITLREPVWEPAAGDGDMARALLVRQAPITSDIRMRVHVEYAGLSFLGEDARRLAHRRRPQSIVTNPPFEFADEFVARALDLTEPVRGMVAMLLPFEYDAAIKTRAHLFRDHRAFFGKLVLGRRIVWVGLETNPKTGKPASPVQVHAWYVWDWAREPGPPRIIYV